MENTKLAQEVGPKLAQELLRIGAFKFSPDAPYTWASGWRSPVYCDNRQTLAHPALRKAIAAGFAKAIRQAYPQAQAIAGVATGAIAHGVLVAEALDLPFLYVRAKAKAHGLGNQVEGQYQAGQQVVVIEDLVSTGGSSLAAVQALQGAGLQVLGLLSIFTYGFAVATERFAEENVPFASLCNLSVLLNVAEQTGQLTVQAKQTIESWRQNPAAWQPA